MDPSLRLFKLRVRVEASKLHFGLDTSAEINVYDSIVHSSKFNYLKACHIYRDKRPPYAITFDFESD